MWEERGRNGAFQCLRGGKLERIGGVFWGKKRKGGGKS